MFGGAVALRVSSLTPSRYSWQLNSARVGNYSMIVWHVPHLQKGLRSSRVQRICHTFEGCGPQTSTAHFLPHAQRFSPIDKNSPTSVLITLVVRETPRWDSFLSSWKKDASRVRSSALSSVSKEGCKPGSHGCALSSISVEGDSMRI